ncbi:MAG TPA: hypothetical protein VD978_04515 [Azospirillum sp.]|nr:hypothetical protein [Azospirillum sp.]
MDRRDRNIGTPARKSLMALALLALAGCSAPKGSEMVLACPKVGIVRELQEVTQFRPGGKDATDMTARAALADYSGNCEYGSDGVTMNLNLFVVAERGPALQGDQATYQYFVAVARPGEDVPASKSLFDTTVQFPKGQTRVNYKEELTPKIPLPKDVNAKDWKVMVGFQLSPEQLDFNMKQAKR